MPGAAAVFLRFPFVRILRLQCIVARQLKRLNLLSSFFVWLSINRSIFAGFIGEAGYTAGAVGCVGASSFERVKPELRIASQSNDHEVGVKESRSFSELSTDGLAEG